MKSKSDLTNIEKDYLSQLLKVKLIRNIRNIKYDDNKSFSQSIINSSSQNLGNSPKSFNNIIINKVINSYDNKEEQKKSNKNTNNFCHSFKYLPKRLIKNKLNDASHQILSHSMLLSPILTHTKNINLEERNNNIKNILSSPRNNINFPLNLNFDDAKFRNEHISKFWKILNVFKNFKNNAELISNFNKNSYLQYYEKLLNCIYNQTDIFFNSSYNLEKDTQSKMTFEFKSLINKIISNIEEYNNYLNKFLKILFNELNNNISNNANIIKLNTNLEIKNNLINRKIKKLNNFIEKEEISDKILMMKKMDNKIKKAKLHFIKKENNYLIVINELKKEIKNMGIVLDKNKEYYDKYMEKSIIIEQNKKERNEIKKQFLNELNNLKIKQSLEKYDINKLNEKLRELEDIIEKIKEKNNEYKRKEIELKMKIKELEKIICQKNENLSMINEELNTYINLVYIQSKKDKLNNLLNINSN